MRLTMTPSNRWYVLLALTALGGCTDAPACTDADSADGCVAGSEASTSAETTMTDEGSTTMADEGSTTTADESSTGDEQGPPPPPQGLTLGYSQVKQFELAWLESARADYYQLLERENPEADYVQVGPDTSLVSASLTVPLHLRVNASYIVRACNDLGCSDSSPLEVTGNLAEAIGYFKAPNSGQNNYFGYGLALSADGSTLAISSYGEGSNATGIDGNPEYRFATGAGAVFVFVRDAAGVWTQQAYVKASNTEPYDLFGWSVALSADGNTLAVGARDESSSATGTNGDQGDNSAAGAGAVYMFRRDELGEWAQEAYVKASNTGAGDWFGTRVALDDDGNTLAVVAANEASGATNIDGDQTDDSVVEAGAVYLYQRDELDVWTQAAYVKAFNTDANDLFGHSMRLSGDGRTLAVGARNEDSNATTIDGDETNDSASRAGATYVYWRDDTGAWMRQAYLKASNAGADDGFGAGLGLSTDGRTLLVGALGESSNATGIDGDATNDSVQYAGAAYLFTRDEQGEWTQDTYFKASNPDAMDFFGYDVALSGDGTTIAINASSEDSNARGLDGDQTDDSYDETGAIYVFSRDPQGEWVQAAYVKAPNGDPMDFFGVGLALSADGQILAAASFYEASAATEIGGDQALNIAPNAGAVYLY